MREFPTGWFSLIDAVSTVRWGVCALLCVVIGCGPTLSERSRIYIEDGHHLYRCGAYADARQTFTSALQLRPGDPTLLYNIAQCHEQLGETRRAEQLYRDTVQRTPRHVEARHALNVLLVREGRGREANQLVDEWIAREPSNASAYAEQAWLLRQDGNLPQAQARLQQALDLDPQNVHALLEMGQLYEIYAFPDRALALYERAEQIDPRHPEVRERLENLRLEQVGRPRPDR